MGRLSAGCDSLERLSIGAYVLGALDPSSVPASSSTSGLRGMPGGAASQMAGLPGLLSRSVSRTPSTRRPLLLAARRRRLAAIGSVAAVAAVAAALILALATGG